MLLHPDISSFLQVYRCISYIPIRATRPTNRNLNFVPVSRIEIRSHQNGEAGNNFINCKD